MNESDLDDILDEALELYFAEHNTQNINPEHQPRKFTHAFGTWYWAELQKQKRLPVVAEEENNDAADKV
jgi:hypothetical protein